MNFGSPPLFIHEEKPSFYSFGSNGCIHVHPDTQKKIVQILVEDLGVVVRRNTFRKRPYPYVPQGLLSIDQIEQE